MKDNELCELLAQIDRKIEAAMATIIGGDPKDSIDRIQKSLNRIQELAETRDIQQRVDEIKVIPPYIPAIIGIPFGALLFAAGMLLAWLLLK